MERTTENIISDIQTAIDDMIGNLDGFRNTLIDICKSKRVLRLGNIETKGDEVSFQIVEQSHRNDGFARDGSCLFIDSNGFALSCAGYPMVSRHLKLFCRGVVRKYDNKLLTTDTETFAKILIAVKEYNSEG